MRWLLLTKCEIVKYHVLLYGNFTIPGIVCVHDMWSNERRYDVVDSNFIIFQDCDIQNVKWQNKNDVLYGNFITIGND